MTEPAAHAPPKRQNRVEATWAGDQAFDTGRPGGPRARIDGHGDTGQSPVDALLSALAACTSIDVVEILSKCRTPVGALRVDVVGDRASATPAKVTRILLTFHVDGEGIRRTQVERAVELAVTKYCSVRDTLDPALPIEWAIVVNGA